MPAEGIWFPVSGTGTVNNLEVKLRKFLSPMKLPLIPNFGSCEVFQILVVGEYQNRKS
jgi:hypothetical protein